jgi:hypothetical protein
MGRLIATGVAEKTVARPVQWVLEGLKRSESNKMSDFMESIN